MSSRYLPKQQRRGLILLVVLSMLTLFSMLAITYVVYSSQSRSSNMGMARRDYHRMPPDRLVDEAVMQVLRGTVNSRSTVGPHSLLADIYGHRESLTSSVVSYRARFSNNNDRGEYLAKRFLRVPLDTTFTGGTIPNLAGDLAGRVLTFLEGPLANQSFRIVRSTGDLTGSSLQDVREQTHSVIIDLSDTKTSLPTNAYDLTQGTSVGYRLKINAREFNSNGLGIQPDGTTDNYPTTALNSLPVSLQPRYQSLAAGNTSGSWPLNGDTDESYDAADYNDFWLAYRRASVTNPEDIIPSFHRAALINYIVNSEPDLTDTSSFTQDEFREMLAYIERACGRPLGISVVNLENPGPTTYRSEHINFTGSNLGTSASGFPDHLPTLDIDLGGSWSNWTMGTPSPYLQFISWVRFLTRGPWDVDNDGDGINDSVWIDLDLPLITSPEGKLLKMLAAYYIEDLDSRLDLNAVGNLTQRADNRPADDADTGSDRSYAIGQNVKLPQGFGLGPAESSLRHLFASDSNYVSFMEARYGGTGARPGEGTNLSSADDLRSQLDGGGDLYITQLLSSAINSTRVTGTRERRSLFRHDLLPGLPTAIRGGEAMTVDLLGNPVLIRSSNFLVANQNQGVDDPYESRLITTPHQDLPFTITDWERIYRLNDWDRSGLPNRLDGTAIATNARLVTPRSSHLRRPAMPIPTFTGSVANPSSSFYGLLQTIGATRLTPVTLDPTDADMRALFPLEFAVADQFDVNRPLGNGVDDDMDGQIDEPEESLKNAIDDDGDMTYDEFDELSLAHRERAPYIGSGAVGYSNSTADGMPITTPTALGYSVGDGLDPDYEGVVTSSPLNARLHHGQQSRQLYARHLYCLAMLLLPDPIYTSTRPGVAINGADRARLLAQWAVNVVDFRDADHVMTRFPYDADPFTKKTINSINAYWIPNSDATGAPIGNVVWGMEQPELLMTESLAVHDLRVKDTAEDASGRLTTDPTNADTDFDQYRVPQGSLFLEFLCPRTTVNRDSSLVPGVAIQTVPGGSESLYVGDASNNARLNLSALTPSDGTTRYPVWRVAISKPHPQSMTSALRTYLDTANRLDVTYQIATATEAAQNGLRYHIPLASNASPPSIPTPELDRILWFTDPAAAGISIAAAAPGLPSSILPADVPAHVFGNAGANPLSLGGGQYLVVGPRQVTNFGSKTSSETSHFNEPNNHRIVLEGNTVTSGSVPVPYASWATVYSGDNQIIAKVNDGAAMNPVPLARDIVAMIAVTSSGLAWTGANVPATVGLNVSEPHPTATDYYDEPTEQLNSNDGTGDPTNGAQGFDSLPKDAYHDYGASTASMLPDTPFDARPGTPIKDYYEPQHAPANNMGVAAPGTELDWSTAYLQRLADPERPWNAVFNPYITVDWLTIDLTVISGEAAFPGGSYRLASRQKNGNLANSSHKALLSYSLDDSFPVINNPSSGTSFFNQQLQAEDAAGTYGNPSSPRPTQNTSFSTLGYLNSPFEILQTPSAVLPVYVGTPLYTPPSLAWFNRPFTSPYEMMLVPTSSPGQLMQEFSVPTDRSPMSSQFSNVQQGSPFPGLLNFFQQTLPPPTPPLPIDATALFELCTTPSQWIDAEKYINPNDFNYNTTDAAHTRQLISIGTLAPPYNRISRMVEPGRVNINTVADSNVWRGVEWNYLRGTDRLQSGGSAYWDELLNSRGGGPLAEGYLTSPTEAIPGLRNAHLNADYPTEFPGVFRSSLSASFVPTTRASVLNPTPSNPSSKTLLRPRSTGVPLFSPVYSELTSAQPNAFNEYLPIMRLNNLVTTRSNVFAVRVTIGYFEYDPSAPPGQLALGIGQEYGWDNNKTRRHRGFYVVDRSIPVGFQPGEDLNTENCILLRRYVE